MDCRQDPCSLEVFLLMSQLSMCLHIPHVFRQSLYLMFAFPSCKITLQFIRQ